MKAYTMRLKPQHFLRWKGHLQGPGELLRDVKPEQVNDLLVGSIAEIVPVAEVPPMAPEQTAEVAPEAAPEEQTDAEETEETEAPQVTRRRKSRRL